jgi:hypothetical protein
MQIAEYLDEVRSKHASGQATEHSYRPVLEKLFRSIDPNLEVINEPRRVKVGAPDFVFNRGLVSIGWGEAKDLGKDIRRLKDYSREQKERYRKAFPNLIYTNGIDFEFLRESAVVNFVSIADYLPSLPARPDRFDELVRNLKTFTEQIPVSIRSPTQLANFMAGKASMIKDVMRKLLEEDSKLKTPLGGQFKAFKAELLPNLRIDEFADIYAETITYGMFAARLHDKTLDTFSRSEALQLLPKSNPFLRSLFSYIAGPELDDRITWIIDDLAEVLRASDPAMLFAEFKSGSAKSDPFIHFYEDFLREYNPKRRKAKGVWYTPEPVVDYIVRSVDAVLSSEFGLADGLADTSKVILDDDTGMRDKKGKPVTEKREFHRVQILDPATGTGTFLAKSVRTICDRVKARAPGKWSGYVESELIPRVHGFELLMASYTMCHMKLDMILGQTDYKPSPNPPRLSVWLTDSLEEGDREVRDLFFTALADEARGANEVKRHKPIMCIIGNPPYSGESDNQGPWISRLMEAYKKEPGTTRKLDEKNSKWINKDEHKFIRLATEFIERGHSGVLGFITSHGYLSDPTLRGMRWHLLSSFDKIFVLDLHGNANRKDIVIGSDGDQNVFDIKQGVAIIIAVKHESIKGTKKQPARVIYQSLQGSREYKYEFLRRNKADLYHVDTPIKGPMWRFTPSDEALAATYDLGFSLKDLFIELGNGIVTKRDALCIQKSEQAVWDSIEDFVKQPEYVVRAKYKIPEDVRDWTYDWAKKDVIANFRRSCIRPILYRPFDIRYIFYTGNARGFVGWPVQKIMHNYIDGPNLGLLAPKANRDAVFAHALVTDRPTEAILLSSATGSNAMNFPLYVYADDPGKTRDINFHPRVFAKICETAGIPKVGNAYRADDFAIKAGDQRPSEVKVFDYIYGVLHTPYYRTTYVDFLKQDYPKIPYPKSADEFIYVSKIGESLRRLHLLSAPVEDGRFTFVGEGDDVVFPAYPMYKDDRVYINEGQYFDDVPASAWGMLVGGYQPSQKWLKDRRGAALSWQDIGHYQKLLWSMAETDRIMRGIQYPLQNPAASCADSSS